MSQPPNRSIGRLVLTNGLVSLILGTIVATQTSATGSEKWIIVTLIVVMAWGLGIAFDYLRLRRR